MELRQLRYFLALAEELHFGRAAARLHVVQPALSQQIRRLEDELGVRLFHRTKRQVSLTGPGAAFLQKARLTLAHAGEAAAAAQRAGRGEIGALSVGFVGSAAFNFLPELLKSFRRSFPGVRLVLQELTTTQQVAALRAASIGVGLLRPPIADGNIRIEVLAREPWLMAVPRSHRLCRRSRRRSDSIQLAERGPQPARQSPLDPAIAQGLMVGVGSVPAGPMCVRVR